jgi:hypothetical protein
MDVKPSRSGLEAVVKQTLMILKSPSAGDVSAHPNSQDHASRKLHSTALQRVLTRAGRPFCLSAFHECDTSISTNTPVVGTVRLEETR